MAPKDFKTLDLPKSTFDFADAFEGTSIPKPPPSPPPQAKSTQLKLNGGLSSHPTTPTDTEMKDADGSMMPPPAKKQAVSPTSPDATSTKRPSSVRKLLSLRSLREKNHNHQSLASPTAKNSTSEWDSRPGSPYGASPSILSDGSARPSLAKKRSSGWFGSRRKSGFFGGSGVDENAVPNGGAVQPVKKGPPPPTIPEFKEFGSINGALSNNMSAEDMFKDIK